MFGFFSYNTLQWFMVNKKEGNESLTLTPLLKNQNSFFNQNTKIMARFKPTVLVGDKDISYPTYQKLKSELKNLLEQSPDGIVRVYRSRRGQWGEWFEHWQLNYQRKPVIIKQGWM